MTNDAFSSIAEMASRRYRELADSIYTELEKTHISDSEENTEHTILDFLATPITGQYDVEK